MEQIRGLGVSRGMVHGKIISKKSSLVLKGKGPLLYSQDEEKAQ